MTSVVDASVIDNLGIGVKEKARKGSNELGEDAFLKLVLAQLENQDPMNPMENGEFLAQLAQMKSVTGIEKLNVSVDQLVSNMQSNQALQASSLVGRWVMVEGDTGVFFPEIGLNGAADVPQGSSNVLVSVKNQAGEIIRQIDYGDQPSGKFEFVWDGLDGYGNEQPPGKYTIEAHSMVAGNMESLKTYVVNPVESVTINNNTGAGFSLNVTGSGSIRLSDVQKVM